MINFYLQITEYQDIVLCKNLSKFYVSSPEF